MVVIAIAWLSFSFLSLFVILQKPFVLAIKAFLQALLLDDLELCTLWSRYLWLSCWFSCLLSVIITCLVFSLALFLLSHNSES